MSVEMRMPQRHFRRKPLRSYYTFSVCFAILRNSHYNQSALARPFASAASGFNGKLSSSVNPEPSYAA